MESSPFRGLITYFLYYVGEYLTDCVGARLDLRGLSILYKHWWVFLV